MGTIITFVAIAYSTSRAATRSKLLTTSSTASAASAPVGGTATSEDLAAVLDLQPAAAIPMTTTPATATPMTAIPAAASEAFPAVPGSTQAPLATAATTGAATAVAASAAPAAPALNPADIEAGVVPPPRTKESHRRYLEEAVEAGALPPSALVRAPRPL